MALNRREKALLSLPLMLSGAMGFYNWVHEPLFLRRAEVKERSEQVQVELKRDKAKLAREGDLVSRRSAVMAREQTVDSWVPGKNSAALFVWYLSQAEEHSGAHIRGITVSERRQVAAADHDDASGQATPVKPAQAASSTGAQAATPTGPLTAAATTLTVIRLDLTVEARFAEHMLFNQAMEQTPLFLNTEGLKLERTGLPVDRAGELVTQGNTHTAGQLLRASPVVSGTYHVNLYFKSEKAGPATSPMQFGEGSGRGDPFAMTDVDEFIQTVSDFYANPLEVLSTTPGSGRYRSPNYGNGQLG